MKLGIVLRSLVASIAVVVNTVVFASGAIAAGLILSPTSRAVHWMYRNYARATLLGFGARVQVQGHEKLQHGKRYILVSNHQSHLDALAILTALPEHPMRFIAKQDLRRVPMFGWALGVTGSVFVTRSDTGKDLQTLDAAQQNLLRDVSVLFFAEGTRSLTGQLGEFKKGAAVFAIKAGMPLVPIGVAGSYEIYSRGFEVKRGGTIVVSVGEPIEADQHNHDDREALTFKLREAVSEQIARGQTLLDKS